MRIGLAVTGVAVALAAATSCFGAEVAGEVPAAAAATPTSVARLAPAPSVVELERLRKQSRNSVALVWCGARKFELPALRLDSTGVWSADGSTYKKPRLAIVQTPDAVRFDPPPKPIAWSTIDSIAVTGRGPGMGTVFLGTAGLAMVVGLPIAGAVIANATHSAGSGTPGTIAIVAPIFVAGVLAASLVRHHDKVAEIYRAR